MLTSPYNLSLWVKSEVSKFWGVSIVHIAFGLGNTKTIILLKIISLKFEYWLKCLSSICSRVTQPAEPRECVCECVLPSFTWAARALAGWPALSSFRSIRPTIQKCRCLVVSNVKTLVLSIYTWNLCFQPLLKPIMILVGQIKWFIFIYLHS